MPATALCFRKSLIFICFTLGLTACTTLGPEYKEPKVEWFENWQPDLYGQVDNTSMQTEFDLRFWWQMFDDAALNNLIEISQKKNINLRIAGLRILESRAQLSIVDSSLYPQVLQINGSALATDTQRRGGALPSDDNNFTSYQAGFNLGWELDFWGKFQRGIESANAAFFNSVANQQNIQVLLNSQLVSLYYSYRTTEQRIDIARKNAEIQERSYKITENIYLAGQDSELDLQQAKSQYLATLSTIPKLQISLTKTRNALATLLARPPGVISELKTQPGKLPSMNTLLLTDIPAKLLTRRPDIRSAAWQVAAQSAQIGLAEADYYPSISLLGSIGWSSTSDSDSPNNSSFSIGPGLTWNLFNFGRIENNIRVQDARLQQLIEQYQDTVLSAAREVDDAAISVVKTNEQINILTQSVKASERALVLANTRFREGYSDFQRVLDAQRAVFTQTDQALANRGSHINAIIDLYKSLGGGWSETSIEQLIPSTTRKTMEQRSDWGELLKAELPLSLNHSSAGTSQHEQ